MGVLLITCKEAALLAQTGMDKSLGPIKRLLLHLHLFRCPGCRDYPKQIKFIRKVLGLCPDRKIEVGLDKSVSLPQPVKEKIQKIIDKSSPDL
jgi:hypothetical protein